MIKLFQNLRDTIIAGVIFLLPLLIIFVLVIKVFQFFRKFTTKAAAFFGLDSIAGISSSTIVGTISLLVVCLICGYLVRISFFRYISEWLDEKLTKLIPGYAVYHEMAKSKLVEKEEMLPYEMAVWVKRGEVTQPGFLMDTMPDGRLVIFLPMAGNVSSGNIELLHENSIERCPNTDMKKFKMAITNLGLGFSTVN